MAKAKKGKYEGKCFSCGRVLGKTGIVKHLRSCVKDGEGMLLYVGARYNPAYWMYLEIPDNITLAELDDFLRSIWLECCGHLSAFTINGRQYAASPMPEYGDKSMRGRLSKLVQKGDSFVYEYDFGTTTELMVRVLKSPSSKSERNAVNYSIKMCTVRK